MTESENGAIAVVTDDGRMTIPRCIRNKLRLDLPGHVRFVETEDGEVVVRPVKRPSKLRGALKDEETDQETPATELLCEERQQDTEATDEKHGLSERGG